MTEPPTIRNDDPLFAPRATVYGTRSALGPVPEGDSGVLRPMRRPVDPALEPVAAKPLPYWAPSADVFASPAVVAAIAAPPGPPVAPSIPATVAGHSSRWTRAEENTVIRLLTDEPSCAEAESFIADYTRETGKVRTPGALAFAVKRIESTYKLALPPAVYNGLLALSYIQPAMRAESATVGNPSPKGTREAQWSGWEENVMRDALAASTTAEAFIALMTEKGSTRTPAAYGTRLRRKAAAGTLPVAEARNMAYLIGRVGAAPSLAQPSIPETLPVDEAPAEGFTPATTPCVEAALPPPDATLGSPPVRDDHWSIGDDARPEAQDVPNPEEILITGAAIRVSSPTPESQQAFETHGITPDGWKMQRVAAILNLVDDGVLTDDAALAAIRRVRASLKR